MFRSRRNFVRLTSTAAAAGILWPMRAIAELDPRLPIADALGRTHRPLLDQDEVATRALEAARAAGASYADVRVDDARFQSISVRDQFGGSVGYKESSGVGIRVIANGQWGFSGLSAPVTLDAVGDAARRAVEEAKVNATARKTAITLPPVPVVRDGEWATAVLVDPFTVPVGEVEEAMLAGTKAAWAVSGVTKAEVECGWQRLRRTFASTEGSRIRQAITMAFPVVGVTANAGMTDASKADAGPKGLEWKAGGYEVLRDYALADGMRIAGEEAMRESKALLAAAPARSVDVGRYELVVNARVMAALVQSTIVDAVGMDRALGRLAGDDGTTFAAPPERVVGSLQMASSLLTVRADRTMPGGLMTVGWDDEGVKPDAFALVEQGMLVDYLALRETASILGAWYSKRGMRGYGHGCAAASGFTDLPEEATPNLSIEPGSAAITVEDMIKDVKRGVYLTGGGVDPDFGMIDAFGGAADGAAQEIRNGRLVGPLKDVGLQFQTQQFWKGLLAVGGSGAQVTYPSGQPLIFGCRTIRSVPAHFREVNVVNTGRTE